MKVVDQKVVTDCYGNIIPCSNTTFAIGSPTRWFRDGFIDSLHVNSITSNLTVIGSGNVTSTYGTAGYVPYYTTTTNISASGIRWETSSSNVTMPANLNVSGNVTAQNLTRNRSLFIIGMTGE